MSTTEIAPDKSIKITWGALFAIVAFVFVVGGIGMSNELTFKEHGEAISRIQSQQDKVQNKLDSIDKKLTRMETLMEYIHNQRGK